MTRPVRRYFFKRNYLKKLSNDAWLKEAMALYSDATQRDVIMLRVSDLEKKSNLLNEIDILSAANMTAGDGEDPKEKYDREKRIKEIEKEVAQMDVRIKGRDRAIEQLKTQAELLRRESDEIWHRRKIFLETF